MEDKYSKEKLFQNLIKGHESYKSKRLQDAFEWAYTLHNIQQRKSGEPYIIHPIEVAKDLMLLNMDEDTIIASLLHDVIEDCSVHYDEINKKFGITVADLVKSETKVDELTTNSDVKFEDYENLRRMLFAMTDDIRVIIIRLADRLHNMRTITYLAPERQITYSKETLNVYVPLAEYINIGVWKRELEDIAFRVVNQNQYHYLEKLIKEDPRSSEQNIFLVKKELENLMKENKIPCEISGRVKSAASLHNKIMKYLNKNKIDVYSTSEIHDLLAVRLITHNNNVIDCYKALGAIHSIYEHIPSEFDDYISRPKDNGYQSLQTDIYIKDLIVEVQIRTKKMHEFNEYGAASHIAYKIGDDKTTNAFSWVKNLVKWQDKKKKDYSIKHVLADKIFVFTPTGQLIEMQKGATVIDFAYRIHTRLGNSCIGAKVNGKIVTLNTKIDTGDVIEIMSSKNKNIPSQEWESWVLPRTAGIIRRELSKLDRDSQVIAGKEDFKQKLFDLKMEISQKEIDQLANEYSGGDEEEFFRRVHLRMINLSYALKTVLKKSDKEKTKPEFNPDYVKENSDAKKYTILVKGHKGIQYYLAKCCSPTQKDKIIGFTSLEHGVTVHKTNCRELKSLPKERLVDVEWREES
ncbi:MAG: RelA/SpoT family protein [bacterium]